MLIETGALNTDDRPIMTEYTSRYSMKTDAQEIRIASISDVVFVVKPWSQHGEPSWLVTTEYREDGYEVSMDLILIAYLEASDGVCWWRIDPHTDAGKTVAHRDREVPHLGTAICLAWPAWLEFAKRQIAEWRLGEEAAA